MTGAIDVFTPAHFRRSTAVFAPVAEAHLQTPPPHHRRQDGARNRYYTIHRSTRTMQTRRPAPLPPGHARSSELYRVERVEPGKQRGNSRSWLALLIRALRNLDSKTWRLKRSLSKILSPVTMAELGPVGDLPYTKSGGRVPTDLPVHDLIKTSP